MVWQFLRDAIMFMIEGTLGGLLYLMPEPPGWVSTGFDYMATAWSFVDDFDHWIPVDLALAVAAAVTAAWIVSSVIGLLRVVVSYFTFGGGAT